MTDSNEKPLESNVENAPLDEKSQLQELADKYKNDYLYLRAEFENYKKQTIKERSDLLKYGSERLAKDLLAVVDNFERALQVELNAETLPKFKQGVEMTANDLKNLLSKHGIQEVPSLGLPFDPQVHEALTSELSQEMAAGHVLRVFQKAYKMHEKLIRPAQVVVSKAE